MSIISGNPCKVLRAEDEPDYRHLVVQCVISMTTSPEASSVPGLEVK
jgi:hypothetical protein